MFSMQDSSEKGGFLVGGCGVFESLGDRQPDETRFQVSRAIDPCAVFPPATGRGAATAGGGKKRKKRSGGDYWGGRRARPDEGGVLVVLLTPQSQKHLHFSSVVGRPEPGCHWWAQSD